MRAKVYACVCVYACVREYASGSAYSLTIIGFVLRAYEELSYKFKWTYFSSRHF